MAPQDEIDALKTQVAALGARLDRLEQQVAAMTAMDEQIILPDLQATVPRPAESIPRSQASLSLRPVKSLLRKDIQECAEAQVRRSSILKGR
jgi:hypothetical protein